MPEQANLKFAGFTGWIPVSPTKKNFARRNGQG